MDIKQVEKAAKAYFYKKDGYMDEIVVEELDLNGDTCAAVLCVGVDGERLKRYDDKAFAVETEGNNYCVIWHGNNLFIGIAGGEIAGTLNEDGDEEWVAGGDCCEIDCGERVDDSEEDNENE